MKMVYDVAAPCCGCLLPSACSLSFSGESRYGRAAEKDETDPKMERDAHAMSAPIPGE